MISRFTRRDMKMLDDAAAGDDADYDDKLDQYVLVDVDEDDDDEIVVVENFQVQNRPSPSDPCVGNNINLNAVVTDSIGEGEDKEVAKQTGDERYLDDETDDDLFDTDRKKVNGGILIILIVTLFLFDAGDLNVFYGRSSTKLYQYHPNDCSAMRGDNQYTSFDEVPRVAPMENKEVLCFDCPSEDWNIIEYSDNLMIPSLPKMDGGMMTFDVESFPSFETVRPLIVAKSDSDSALALLEPHVPTDRKLKPTTSNLFIPMKSLIPYTPPRRIEEAILVPSVRDYDNWFPTFNWTVSSMDMTAHPIHPAFVVVHPPDRRPVPTDEVHSVDRNQPTATETSTSIALTQNNFYEFIYWHENVLVTMYFPCERYDTKFVPMWKNLTDMIEHEQLPIITASLDCHSHPYICREQGCYRFPTIRWYNKGKVFIADITRGRNAHKLFRFIKRKLNYIRDRDAEGPFRINNVPILSPRSRNYEVPAPTKASDVVRDFNDRNDNGVLDNKVVLRTAALDTIDDVPKILLSQAVAQSPCPIMKDYDESTGMRRTETSISRPAKPYVLLQSKTKRLTVN